MRSLGTIEAFIRQVHTLSASEPSSCTDVYGMTFAQFCKMHIWTPLLQQVQAGVNATILILSAVADPSPAVLTSQLAAGDIAKIHLSSTFSVFYRSSIGVRRSCLEGALHAATGHCCWQLTGVMHFQTQHTAAEARSYPQGAQSTRWCWFADQHGRQAPAAAWHPSADSLSAGHDGCCGTVQPACEPHGSERLQVESSDVTFKVSNPGGGPVTPQFNCTVRLHLVELYRGHLTCRIFMHDLVVFACSLVRNSRWQPRRVLSIWGQCHRGHPRCFMASGKVLLLLIAAPCVAHATDDGIWHLFRHIWQAAHQCVQPSCADHAIPAGSHSTVWLRHVSCQQPVGLLRDSGKLEGVQQVLSPSPSQGLLVPACCTASAWHMISHHHDWRFMRPGCRPRQMARPCSLTRSLRLAAVQVAFPGVLMHRIMCNRIQTVATLIITVTAVHSSGAASIFISGMQMCAGGPLCRGQSLWQRASWQLLPRLSWLLRMVRMVHPQNDPGQMGVHGMLAHRLCHERRAWCLSTCDTWSSSSFFCFTGCSWRPGLPAATSKAAAAELHSRSEGHSIVSRGHWSEWRAPPCSRTEPAHWGWRRRLLGGICHWWGRCARADWQRGLLKGRPEAFPLAGWIPMYTLRCQTWTQRVLLCACTFCVCSSL